MKGNDLLKTGHLSKIVKERLYDAIGEAYWLVLYLRMPNRWLSQLLGVAASNTKSNSVQIV